MAAWRWPNRSAPKWFDSTPMFPSPRRARNAGFARLLEVAPDVEYVQFVDGDCSFAEGWLEVATAYLETHPEVTVACGRRCEREPHASIFNQLCDVEWNTPVGEARSCGGDAMMRVAAVRAVGGYNDAVIAAEDDELCVRLRQNGGRVVRLDHDMTWHDANMHTLT
jgi:GT2 family glycosyltransferase